MKQVSMDKADLVTILTENREKHRELFNEAVVLTQSECAQLVQDDWGWKDQFSQTYTTLTGKAAY